MTSGIEAVYRHLIDAPHAGAAVRIERALAAGRIPYRTGPGESEDAVIAFYVPAARWREAAHRVSAVFASPARFPTGEVYAVSWIVLAHLGLLFVTRGVLPVGRDWVDRGALVAGRVADEPWRLVTSLFLHADLSHVLWNGLALVVFGVALLEQAGMRWAGLVYLASGVGGGLTATGLAEPGTRFIGSSGAVAGLFGAWIVLALARTVRHDLPWRARVRVIGLALLVLPSWITPATPSGDPVSVASHLGGLATGILVGGLIAASVLLPREREPYPKAPS